VFGKKDWHAFSIDYGDTGIQAYRHTGIQAYRHTGIYQCVY